MENVPSVHLGDFTYPLVKFKLRAWLDLEDLYTQILEAAEAGNKEKFTSSLYCYVSTAFSIPIDDVKGLVWNEIARAFTQSHNYNRLDYQFPVLRRIKEKRKATQEGWEYPGRSWFIWLHLLVKLSGWQVQYIENLDPNTAIGLLQEIFIDEQLDKEFLWSMSEIAYPYSEATKKSSFHPLDRPEWMKPKVTDEVPKVKFKRSDLPMGLVLKYVPDTKPQ